MCGGILGFIFIALGLQGIITRRSWIPTTLNQKRSDSIGEVEGSAAVRAGIFYLLFGIGIIWFTFFWKN